jgi:hypothetical protein
MVNDKQINTDIYNRTFEVPILIKRTPQLCSRPIETTKCRYKNDDDNLFIHQVLCRKKTQNCYHTYNLRDTDTESTLFTIGTHLDVDQYSNTNANTNKNRDKSLRSLDNQFMYVSSYPNCNKYMFNNSTKIKLNK